jgi:hypothetical protein
MALKLSSSAGRRGGNAFTDRDYTQKTGWRKINDTAAIYMYSKPIVKFVSEHQVLF